MLIATVFAGMAVQIGKYLASTFLVIDTGTGILGQATLAAALGIVIYLIVSKLLGSQEFNLVFRWFPKIDLFKRN
jgi:hypothetical protein